MPGSSSINNMCAVALRANSLLTSSVIAVAAFPVFACFYGRPSRLCGEDATTFCTTGASAAMVLPMVRMIFCVDMITTALSARVQLLAALIRKTDGLERAARDAISEVYHQPTRRRSRKVLLFHELLVEFTVVWVFKVWGKDERC